MQETGPLQFLKSLSLVALVACSTAVASASTITYNLVGATTAAGSVTGTVDIDTSSKVITSAQITFHDVPAGSPVFTTVGSTAAYNGISQAWISGPSNGPLNYGGQLALYFDTANVGTANLPICVVAGACGLYGSPGSYAQVYVSSGNGGPFYLTGGELDLESTSTNTVATAEPPSLVLLGTGIVFSAALLARFSGRDTVEQA